MSLDCLNPDLQRLIVSHLDENSVHALSALDTKKDTYWSHIVKTSKVNYDGPANSTIFSIFSLVKFGPRCMPHVIHLDLVLYDSYSFLELNEELLLEALMTLKLSSKRKFVLSLRICENIYAMKRVRSFLQLFTYQKINYVGKSFYAIESNDSIKSIEIASDSKDMIEDLTKDCNEWQVKDLQCQCDFFVQSKFTGLENLELTLDNLKSMQPEESQAIMQAFTILTLKTLTTNGPFLTPLVIQALPLNLSLESLSLFGYTNSYFDWSKAKLLQSFCPNIKHFTIQYSNLVTRDLEYFDWSLWNLESLDISYNYTLRNVSSWPKGLVKLCTNDTSLDLTSSLLDTSKLKYLSVDLSATYEWAHYLSSIKTIEQLNLNMLHFLSGTQFLAASKLIGGPWFWEKLKKMNCAVFVRLKEAFFRENILESHGDFLRAWHV
jgi:hypothetical protein